ncbi:Phospholipid phosphatase 1 [Liparis tanakae]|uniref:Phospholipid phosphatase 1 n=1 Tax=Liparis tanakae TaxID=230148 RepID=A0A4Z2GYG2_9TELE|nr:Phospholipid phosphatase 1 [Liparis tanakae]
MFEARGVPFVLLDVVCLVIGGLPLAAFNLGKIRPYQRGFFCNDESIQYPFHHGTISSTVLYTVGFALPISCMILGECLSVYLKRIKSKSSFGSYVSCVYKAVGTFLFGAAMSQSLTDIAKYSIGRLRPHFLDVCKPDWKLINCSSGEYIENFTCTGDLKMANEGRCVYGVEGEHVLRICHI